MEILQAKDVNLSQSSLRVFSEIMKVLYVHQKTKDSCVAALNSKNMTINLLTVGIMLISFLSNKILIVLS